MVVDIGPLTNWVKINVQKTKDCYEIYALVRGLLREEVVSLPSKIDPYQTSVVVTLHGAKRWHPLENGGVEFTCDI
uniref:Uncharacterized protein n=1 Tax=Solanum lycopersicum TaxID=4081 RepID=K4B494_SOLLC